MQPLHLTTAQWNSGARPAPGQAGYGAGSAAGLPSASHGAAMREYRAVDLEARVAAASPHQLILMLFDRLVVQLRSAHVAATAGDRARRLLAIEKALALVDGLDMTLDDARGGDVAASLHAAYRLIRDRLRDGGADPLADAGRMATSLADAWRAIAPVPQPAAAASRQIGPDRV